MTTELKKEAVGMGSEKKRSLASMFHFDVKTYTMILALVSIWVIFTMATNGDFLTSRNLSNLFRQMSITGILSIGMVFIIIAGHIDLSVGSLMGLLGGITAVLNVWLKIDGILAIGITLVLGLLIGLFNGWLIAYKKIPAFIVTLGGMLVFRGILVGMTKGTTVASLDPSIRFVGNAYLVDGIGIFLGIIAVAFLVYNSFSSRKLHSQYGLAVPSMSVEIAKIAFAAVVIGLLIIILNSYQGVPVPVLILAIMAVAFSYVLTKTVFGRRVYAIGGNAEAAKLSGINVTKMTLSIFAINGLLVSIAGILLCSRLNAASVAAGQNAEMDAIAACVIGGASLMGGLGSVGGAIVGALVMASLDNGMSMLNIETFWQFIVKGSILVLAVWVDIATKNKR
ncbi:MULTISPECIES: sugar ABC transporter permease [Pelosinus]|uniref:Xylose transport system permease protein XylH n=1 Tax=Pelosinus fermentans B4 TaxID=1149862 RepID=I9LJH2_9FIRM|nr:MULTISPECIES: sugar ABC transporter permease [Pelosinus]EIW20571.1 ABC-type transporter, integral membrane subunit [Pelosinus fermentans B4]EIW25714.1 ABC-type transporter, integral membrane subunit [Pelosinus fermentans A11]OAM93438.1 ABC-type transporter, integral membrane subunit [Pelosinus fermentans DSM 17108]SDQ77833.1 xylose ABC transporter membrane protein [Pelosinus fermentans]